MSMNCANDDVGPEDEEAEEQLPEVMVVLDGDRVLQVPRVAERLR